MLKNWMRCVAEIRETAYPGRGFVTALVVVVIVLVGFDTIVAWQVHVQTFNVWFGLSRFLALASLIALGPRRTLAEGVSVAGRARACVVFAAALLSLWVALRHSMVI